jgi:hypothetical protein
VAPDGAHGGGGGASPTLAALTPLRTHEREFFSRPPHCSSRCSCARRSGLAARRALNADRQWEGQDGSPHSKHEVVANQIDFLAKPTGNGAGEPQPAYSDGEEPF